MTKAGSRHIDEFTDKELADMVRESIYVHNTRFGTGDNDAQYLVLFAAPYGRSEDVTSTAEAIEAFQSLVSDDDWRERSFQVYDHTGDGSYSTVCPENEQEQNA